MEGKRLLRTLRLTNFLSYGPEGVEIELEPLNVLIGPNGSGKSNLVEAIGLLKEAPRDISRPIQAGGGMAEWLWKGDAASPASHFQIETTVFFRKGLDPLRHRFCLEQAGQRFVFAAEIIDSVPSASGSPPAPFYRFQDGEPVLFIREKPGPVGPLLTVGNEFHLGRENIDVAQSILSQRKDPDRFPELTYLGEMLSEIHLFRNCSFGPGSALRRPQRADESARFLFEDGRNLGIVLNDLLNRPQTKKRLLAELKRFYGPIEDVTTKIVAGTVETFFHERGFVDSTPSTRLSDGTLRYLCLLAILCHPDPPPVVCIEDPEVALHPDILPTVAELLIEASERMQLIVTTHSDVLVSALSGVPEAVVVCERDDYGSHLRRLNADSLEEWLRKYSLGELWMSGEIGGNP